MGIFHLKNQHTLTLIFYPGPGKINWDSPGQLLRSSAWNTFFGYRNGFKYDMKHSLDWITRKTFIPAKHPHAISHVDVVLTDNKGNSSYSGMGRIKTMEEIISALTGKSTFDKLIKTYPGYIYDEKKINKWLLGFLDHDEVSWITFTLSEPTYYKLKTYEEEYQKRGYHKIYAGFHADPLKGEGAGCAMYARSFLEMAHLNSVDLEKAWKKTIKIPKNYLPDHKPKPVVSVWEMFLLKKNGHWANDNEPHIKIDLYDPGIMYECLKEQIAKNQKWLGDEIQTIRGSKGLIVYRENHIAPEFPHLK
jgi:hypothetical protein